MVDIAGYVKCACQVGVVKIFLSMAMINGTISGQSKSTDSVTVENNRNIFKAARWRRIPYSLVWSGSCVRLDKI